MDVNYYVILYILGGFFTLLYADLTSDYVGDDAGVIFFMWPLMALLMISLEFSFWIKDINDKFKNK